LILDKPHYRFSLPEKYPTTTSDFHIVTMFVIFNMIFVGRPEGRRPLGRPRHRWEDNIKMDLQQMGWGGMDWIDMAQDRDRWRALVRAVMNLRVP
jgi:hypothetical protein